MNKSVTERVIIETFMRMLNEQPLEKISVKEIVEACGISRNTFYYHYKDIYDLLEDIFETQAQHIYLEHKPRDSWQEALIQTTEFALKNKRAIYHIYNSVNREQLERYLFNVTQEIMMDFVRGQAEGLDVSEKNITYISLFYKHAVVGIILEWLQRDMKDNAEEVILDLSKIFDGNIRLTLERISKTK
ncbi:MAG: TetR/AcrR family transcriptional regulator [Clostridium sp.]|nr:TetR/AcrR family transcriptional regulator [Clostridium sp.]MCM1398538.1 TetR/AcrR family transcriptional regulator [Clostridium sp.]MCM1459826.1 TetR/AcrR family transcriptional regulator [Bacteroides sp.]